MSLNDAVMVVSQLAEALDYAHAQGVIHRDIKPANVIITPSGRTVLTDFGIALMLDATVISNSGGTPGTPTYMSPEQGRGAPGDERSDIYALGVLFYQLCTGRVPFEADTPYAVLLKHMSEPLPPPRRLRPELPVAIERIILKALAKNPGDRFQRADQLAASLQALDMSASDGSQPAAAGMRLRTRRSIWLTGVAVLVVVLAALLVRHWTSCVAGPAALPAVTGELEGGLGELAISGSAAVTDTWLDPDLPEEIWQEADLVHLQGPLTPDRLLMRFDLSALPRSAEVISAMLMLRVELWGDQSLPGAVVAYRVLTPWDPSEANYNTPWASPGLAAGIDYDSVPLDVVVVPDDGTMAVDVGMAVDAWINSAKPNYGLVLMMSEDSHNMAHHWIYMSEQPNAADRPTLRISYQVTP